MKLTLVNSPLMAVIDQTDAEAAAALRWHLFEPRPGHFYARAWNGQTRVSLHRFIAARMGVSGEQIDHISADGLDNRRANLRAASCAQNNANRLERGSASGFPGVHRSGHGWVVRVRSCGRTHYYGYTTDHDEAVRRARVAMAEVHGEWNPLLRKPHECFFAAMGDHARASAGEAA